MPEKDTVIVKKKHGKTKKKKYHRVYTGSEKVRIFFGVLVAIALIAAGIHYITRQFTVNDEYDMEVTAVVTSVSKKYDKDENQYKYRATYQYEVRGKKYDHVSNWSSTRYEKGDQMLLTVNSDNPDEVNNYKYLTIGAFIIIVAVFVLYFSFR
ncbi:DUF3592 domain-containing protein [Eubacterium sp.]|uniref:DUF3592 domain-containing protein n=1 Tax=Eubacterium sp. TaxID=142586 RepID=UPI0025D56C2F|nr:DUF3592 domain-containing protein [Eubacterium sp.]MCR5629033.1 DUF3592 domain-containing protein [Eubacterium sp.]